MNLDYVYPGGNPLPTEDRTQAQTDGMPESAGRRMQGEYFPWFPENVGGGNVFFLYGPSRLHCRACPEETRAEAMA